MGSQRYYNFYRICRRLLMVVIIVEKYKRIRVSGVSEMLVKKRLSIFSETLEAYKVEWSVSLVSTTKNKADGLKRVPKH